ncbi:helix-turn-helix domain-containing protein [Flavobacterium rivuli]|uniref:helix-turn-helix domain-containing protein n=1 Tax=Flavobacterium rivuli TaxID=498301 RepID=UPI0003A0B0A8|nr:helix-turn-helix domain-containing protein [Flavobacterium rivuli]
MKEAQCTPRYSSYGQGLYLYYIKTGVPESILMDAFNTSAVRIVLITEGTIKIEFSTEQRTLHAQDILTIPATITAKASGNRYGLYLLTASTPFLVEHSLKNLGKDSFGFLVTNAADVIHPGIQAYHTLTALLTHLGTILTNADASPFQKEKVTLCFNLLLFELAELYHPNSGGVSKRGGQREKLVLGFLTLVAQHSRVQHGVKFYAGRLYVTPNYLNKVVRDITGSTLKHFIEEALLSEAKNLLHATEDTVREVSETLNFSHPGSFSTFFKKRTGISPSSYRRNRPDDTAREGNVYGAFFVVWDKKSGQ